MSNDVTLPDATLPDAAPAGAGRFLAGCLSLLCAAIAVPLLVTGGVAAGLVLGAYAAVLGAAAWARSSAVRVTCGALAGTVGGFFVVAILPMFLALMMGDW